MTHTTTSLPWKITIHTECPTLQDPRAVIDLCKALVPVTQAGAEFAWDHPQSISAWASSQHDCVLQETLQTAVLAQETNIQSTRILRQALTGLLKQPRISLDALAFLLSSLQDTQAKTKRLQTLAETLFQLCSARQIKTNCTVIAPDTQAHCDTVIDVVSGEAFSDSQWMAEQLNAIFENITDLQPTPDDDRSPFEELMAIFQPELV